MVCACGSEEEFLDLQWGEKKEEFIELRGSSSSQSEKRAQDIPAGPLIVWGKRGLKITLAGWLRSYETAVGVGVRSGPYTFPVGQEGVGQVVQGGWGDITLRCMGWW